MRTIKVGLDVGNSAVKGNILSDKNAIIQDVLIPSAINTISDVKFLSFATDKTQYIQILDSVLEHPTDIIAIGQNAIDLPNYQQFDVDTTSYKTNHEITTSLLFGVIAEAIKTGESEIDVILAVSIPIVESKTFNLTKNYQNLLVGRHVIRIYTDGQQRDVTINISSAQVLNEGQAGFLGLLDTVDKDFKKAMDTLYKELGEEPNAITTLEDFLVVDIGEGTTDLAVFRNKRFNQEYSYSITKGYGNILESSMSKAEREGLTIESRKQLQSLLSSTSKRRQSQKALWAEYVDVERRNYVDEVVQTVLKTYGRQSYFDAIIFLGGGFSALTGYTISEEGKISMTDSYLFDELERVLDKNRKTVDLLFGIPEPHSQSINNRGLMQILSAHIPKKN